MEARAVTTTMDDAQELVYHHHDRVVGPSNSGRELDTDRPIIEITLGEHLRMTSSSRPEPIQARREVEYSSIWLVVDYSSGL